MDLLYKILFEVKVLHEYYLRNRVGKSIFEMSSQADRFAFLDARIERGMKYINNDISFDVAPESQKLFDAYKLKLIKTYSGFKIAAEVTKKSLPDDITGYAPSIPLPDDLSIPVMLGKNNSRFDQYTNCRIDSRFDAGYYFSNDSKISGKRSFPALSAEVPVFTTSDGLEQGQIVKFADNVYREFYKNIAGIVEWLSYTEGGFANENDRLVLPLSFYYSFPKEANITSATITLKNINGDTVSMFSFSSGLALGKVQVRVKKENVSLLQTEGVDSQAVYTLQINSNVGFSKSYKVVFNELSSAYGNFLGMVIMNVNTSDPAFNLLDNNGLLRFKKRPDGGVREPVPVFEIRFKSRTSFWRYINNKRKDLDSSLFPDLLVPSNGTLVTKTPRPLTYTSTLFRKQSDNTLHYLPNPAENEGLAIENNKIYSNILVQESGMFPLSP